MEKNNGIIGKNVLVIFEDGQNHYSKKQGVCTGENVHEIILDNQHIIPRHRLVRVEIMLEGHNE